MARVKRTRVIAAAMVSASAPASARIHIVPPHTRPVFQARSSASE
jgi:hypothetical protein